MTQLAARTELETDADRHTLLDDDGPLHRSEVMVAFIDDHREPFGVEPICAVLPIAPSTYYRHRGRQLDPTKRSARAVRDEVLKAIIQRIWREHDQAYGSRKVWKQMGREGLRAARCRVVGFQKEGTLVFQNLSPLTCPLA
jgi:hypothetical protein